MHIDLHSYIFHRKSFPLAFFFDFTFLVRCVILMVVCIIQALVYLIRSMAPACIRGRKIEKQRPPGAPSGYTLNSELETPNTVADDVKPVKPERPWHGANEEDILAMMRFQKNQNRIRTGNDEKDEQGKI